jgi:hypothetical protein
MAGNWLEAKSEFQSGQDPFDRGRRIGYDILEAVDFLSCQRSD